MRDHSGQHLIPITEDEAVKIVRAGHVLSAAFGPAGMALVWIDGEPIPPCIEYLALLRGVLNENMSGAGI